MCAFRKLYIAEEIIFMRDVRGLNKWLLFSLAVVVKQYWSRSSNPESFINTFLSTELDFLLSEANLNSCWLKRDIIDHNQDPFNEADSSTAP